MRRNGVTIGKYHTHEHWGLWLMERTLSLPEVQTNTVDVPGRDGLLDLSTALDGEVHYKNRTLTLTLGTFRALSKQTWSDLLSSFAGYVHGQKLRIEMDEATGFYLLGRGTVSSFEWDYLGKQQFTVTFDCDPWRYKTAITQVTASLTGADSELTLSCDRRPVVPTITTTAETVLTWGADSYSVHAGSHRIPGIRLTQGTHTLKARTTAGTGTIAVSYQEGSL